MDRAYLFFAANYLAQGLIGIAYEPIYYFQKDGLGLSPAQSAVFTAWMSFPFLIKPVFGLLADAAGAARARVLGLTALATAGGWAALALIPHGGYGFSLALLTFVNVGIVQCDVACDAVMVERGRALSKTGRYQAVQLVALYGALVATGLGGGYLAAHCSYRTIFGITALFPLLILASVPFANGELRAQPHPPLAGQLGALARSRRFWTVSALIFLFSFSPYRGTSFFYFQSEALGLSKEFIGLLTTVSGLAGVAGAALFGRVCSRLGTPGLVRLSVAVAAAFTALHWAYQGQASALTLTAAAGTADVFCRLALMDAAAKSCPVGAEATAFSAFMSVFNLAAWASNAAGGWLYASWSVPLGARGAMAALILVSALATAAAWPLARAVEAEPA